MSMSIDEAIENARKKANEMYMQGMLCHANPNDEKLDGIIERAREYEQLAEWLEDYKQIKMLVPLEQALKKEYCKGIDDFITKLDYESGYDEDFNDDECIYEISRMTLLSIAEQLKAGDNNG